MPRTGRGGSRQGTPGTAYSNRTDLQTRKVPVMTGPSPQYGANVASEQAQQAMPIAAAPLPAAPMAPAPAPAPVVPLDAPSLRPDEHVMTGAPSGPGAGPEALGALGPAAPDPVVTGLALLSTLPHLPPELARVKQQLDAASMNSMAP